MMLGMWKLAGVHAKLFLREPPAFFFTLVFPSLLVVIFGSIFGNRPRADWGSPVGYVDLMVPGFLAVLIASVALMGIPIATAALREYKVLRLYRATPLRPSHYIAADVLVNFAMTVLGVIILIVTGKLVFDLQFRGSVFNLAWGFTLAALAFYALGYVIASLSPTARIAQAVGQVLFFPMMFLSGGTVPFEIMSERVRAVSEFLPLTHVVLLFRGLWFGQPVSALSMQLLVMAVMLIAGIAIASKVFRWE